MLVLTRKEGERIRIGDDVVLTVTELRPGLVRLGFEGPTRVKIWREELWQRMQAEQKP